MIFRASSLASNLSFEVGLVRSCGSWFSSIWHYRPRRDSCHIYASGGSLLADRPPASSGGRTNGADDPVGVGVGKGSFRVPEPQRGTNMRMELHERPGADPIDEDRGRSSGVPGPLSVGSLDAPVRDAEPCEERLEHSLTVEEVELALGRVPTCRRRAGHDPRDP